MQAVNDALRHDVHPAIRHRELAAGQVELERPCESRDVTIELAAKSIERRRDLVHAAHRAIRCIAAGVILCGPAFPRLVVLLELLALPQ